MIKGPLMLEMGMLPQVSAATAALMVLFTSSATTMQVIFPTQLSLSSYSHLQSFSMKPIEITCHESRIISPCVF